MLRGTCIYTFNKMVVGAMGRGSWWSGRDSEAADRASMELVRGQGCLTPISFFTYIDTTNNIFVSLI